MKYKHCLYLLLLLFCEFSFAQNNQILYDFDEIPQTLLLNPGAEISYDKHLGIPFLSNIYVQAGVTDKNITYNNIDTYSDKKSDVLRFVYEQDLGSNDYFVFNQQLEVLNAGFRLRNKDYYVSFGVYQQIEGFGSYPTDIVNLFYNGDDQNGDGIPETGVPYNFNEIDLIAELTGVYHIGISKRMNESLNIGARIKLISGSLNISSSYNKGQYVLEHTNQFNHSYRDMNFAFHSSGLMDIYGESVIYDSSDVIPGLFFLNGNIGFAVDFGVTYHINDHLIASASILDLGSTKFSNKVTTYKTESDFVLNDDNYYNPPEGSELDYWEDIFDNSYVLEEIPIDSLTSSFSSNRTPKINTSIKYQIKREKRKNTGKSVFRNISCKMNYKEEELITEFGLQTYTAIRPNKVIWAISPFVTHDFNRFLTAKVTYTYDQFSYKNIGVGISTHYKFFNLYATADNLLDLYKLKDTNYASFQFGMNLIFN